MTPSQPVAAMARDGPRGAATPDLAPTGLAWLLVLAGVCAALHVGKLSPALPVLQQQMQIGWVQAGFLLSMVQLAGMLLGLVVGLAADGFGLRRSMIVGLVLLSLASLAGGLSHSASALLTWRALEGVGFLLACLPAPALIRRLVAPSRLRSALGLWGTFMPLGTALALVAGPGVMEAWGWQVWWWIPAGLTAAMALWIAAVVPADRRPTQAAVAASAPAGYRARLGRTLAAPGPWLVAVAFAVYSAQWLAVIGLLPSIVAASGWRSSSIAWPLALAAAVNMIGNVAAGRLQELGVPGPRLLLIGYSVMALGAWVAFAGPALPQGAEALWRYGGVLAFSMVGGVIPGTLFSIAVAVAPGEDTVATTVGWMQQWSSFGQFAGPPLVAWVAAMQGGWQWTWWVTGTLAVTGMAITLRLRKELRQ